MCLSCGFCCKTMSPINGGYCPKLLKKNTDSGDMYFCSDYENRPIECINHSMPANICPVGISILELTNELISNRIKDIHNVLLSEFGKGLF